MPHKAFRTFHHVVSMLSATMSIGASVKSGSVPSIRRVVWILQRLQHIVDHIGIQRDMPTHVATCMRAKSSAAVSVSYYAARPCWTRCPHQLAKRSQTCRDGGDCSRSAGGPQWKEAHKWKGELTNAPTKAEQRNTLYLLMCCSTIGWAGRPFQARFVAFSWWPLLSSQTSSSKCDWPHSSVVFGVLVALLRAKRGWRNAAQCPGDGA